MKFIYSLILFAFISCSKSKDKKSEFCWECNVSPTEKQQRCSDTDAMPQFLDANGNPYATSNCRKL